MIRWLRAALAAAWSLDRGARRNATGLAEAASGRIIGILVADGDGNRGDDRDRAQTDDQGTPANTEVSLVNTSGLAGRQGRGFGGESRRCNQGRHGNRGNDTLSTEHKAFPRLSDGRHVWPKVFGKSTTSQAVRPNSFLTVAKRLYRIAAHSEKPHFGLLPYIRKARIPGYWPVHAASQKMNGSALRHRPPNC